MSETQAQLILDIGDRLVGEAVDSPSGAYAVIHQGDGNLVVYDTANGTPAWAAGTHGRAAGGRVELRSDGRLVVLDADGAVVWTPPGVVADRLVLGDDGVLTLLAPGRGRVWTSHRPEPAPWTGWSNRRLGNVLHHGEVLRHASLRSPSGRFAFTVEGSGTARLTDRTSGVCVFESGPGNHLAGLVVGDDGVLGWRGEHGGPLGDPALDVQAGGTAGSTLLVTDYGDVQLTDAVGGLLWSSARVGMARSMRAAALDVRFDVEDTPLIRTSFGDDAAWQQLVADAAAGNHNGFTAFLTPISDPVDAGRGVDELARAVPGDTHELVIVADDLTFATPERQLLVVEVGAAEASLEPVRTFRAIPAAIQSIENNLSIANMDWEDFADHLDADGVFRGDCT